MKNHYHHHHLSLVCYRVNADIRLSFGLTDRKSFLSLRFFFSSYLVLYFVPVLLIETPLLLFIVCVCRAPVARRRRRVCRPKAAKRTACCRRSAPAKSRTIRPSSGRLQRRRRPRSSNPLSSLLPSPSRMHSTRHCRRPARPRVSNRRRTMRLRSHISKRWARRWRRRKRKSFMRTPRTRGSENTFENELCNK